jgi:pantothenate kinase
MDDKTRELATSMASDDSFQRRLGLARAVTLMETKNAQKKQQGDYLLTYLLQQQQENRTDASLNFRIGLAGPPGSGKSTMVEALGRYILDELPTKTTTTTTTTTTVLPIFLTDLPSFALIPVPAYQEVVFWGTRLA